MRAKPPATSCLFCAIVRGDAPSYRVLDDDAAVAFLDVRPLFPGHALVVPRRHVVTLPDLDADDVAPFFRSVQRVTRAVEEATAAEGSFVAMNNRVSQSVPHLHAHVVPRRPKDGLRGFFWPRQTYATPEDAETIASAIRAALAVP